MNELTRLITQWADDRNLLNADPTKQMLKLFEESGELASSLARGDNHGAKDGIGDAYVVLTILAEQLGTTMQECVHIAYGEIKDRRGEMINGVFVKEEDLI